MSYTVRAGRRRIALIALVAATVSQVGVGAATAAPPPAAPDRATVDASNLTGDQLAALRAAVAQSRTQAALPATGQHGFLVEFNTPSSGTVYNNNVSRGELTATDAAKAAKARIVRMQDAAIAALPSVAPNSSVLYRTAAVTAGVAVQTDVTNYKALYQLPQVKAIYPITPKVLDNAGTAELLNVPAVWTALGNTGENVEIGVIDTGIDYTHTLFGGSGSVEQYDAIRAVEDQPAPRGVFPSVKVVGGFDFVGDEYDGSNTPQPDPNPLDCNGHGTHVAGTAAGYGVNPDGSTYRGPYNADLDLKSLRIGPGMAPGSDLWALRVFGCEGSTNVVGAAMEYAADPNGDGATNDRLDVVNQSLGATYGVPDDADGVLAGRLQELGLIMIFSAGNSGDTYDVNGSPGNNPRVVSVAASDDGFAVFDGWEIVNRPDLFEPDIRPGLRSVAFEGSGDHTGDLVLPVPGDDPAACSPLSGDYSGRFLVIQADGFACGSVTKSGNAKAAGATGFVIVSDDDSLAVGIFGDPEIPGILVRASDGAVLEAELEAGETLTITFGDSLAGAAPVSDPDAVDTIAEFTSRGSRSSVKPDVTAPGVNTVSGLVGSGDGSLTISGTSMAAPATSGVAALIRSQRPALSADLVKADLMNTAVHDLYTEPGQTGLRYAPNRVGAGRIDAAAALANTVVAYSLDDPGVVSASFGVVEVNATTVSRTKTIEVRNFGGTPETYNLGYEALTTMPGVAYKLSTNSITIAAGGTATFTITLNARHSQMRKTIDPTVSPTQGDLPRQYVADASGRIVLQPAGGSSDPTLRVPVHSNPKPVSDLSESLQRTGANTGDVVLDGQGVRNGAPGTPGSYASTVSAFSLLGHSPELPKCGSGVPGNCFVSDDERAVDLANVGAVSDAPFFGAEGAFLYFGVGSHGPEASPTAFVSYSVFIDADDDGVWDYQLLTSRFTLGGDPIDVPIVLGADRDGNLLPSNEEPAITFLNAAPGSFDTNFFDSETVIMPFPVSALPLINEGNPRIDFGVQSFSGFGTVDDLGTRTVAGFPELTASPMSYNAIDPGLVFEDPDFPEFPAILSISADGTRIPTTADPASYSADRSVGGPKGIMLIHTHNETGEKVGLITTLGSGARGTAVI